MSAQKDQSQYKAKFPWFYLIYFICLAAAISELIFVLRTETDILLEYEEVQPRHTAEAVFNTYFSPPDFPKILADAEYDAEGLSDEELTEYLSEQIGGSELTFAASSSSDAEAMQYIVSAGSKQVAAIELVKSQNTTEHGFTTYNFSRLELFIVVGEAPVPDEPKITYTVTVEAPVGYSVYVDGEYLTDEFLTSTEQKTDIQPYYPSTASGFDYNVYTLYELEEMPTDVTVISDREINADVSFDEKTNTYTSGIVYSEELKAEYSEFVIEALKGFASYTHNVPDSAFSNISHFFDSSSQLYKDVRAVEGNLWMEFASDSDSFEDISAEEFFMFPDGVVSCHISFVQILKRNGKHISEALDMYVFLHPVDGEYKIFEWHQV